MDEDWRCVLRCNAWDCWRGGQLWLLVEYMSVWCGWQLIGVRMYVVR